MNLIQNTKHCFANWRNFKGRAPRGEFWRFILFVLLGMIVLMIVNSLIFGPEIQYTYKADANGNPMGDPIGYKKTYTDGWFGDIFFLVCLVPWLAVSWRRLHDIGKPGYLPFLTWSAPIGAVAAILLMNLGYGEVARQIFETGNAHTDITGTQFTIALVSFALCIILNIIWLGRRSQAGSNTYGPNPNEVPK